MQVDNARITNGGGDRNSEYDEWARRGRRLSVFGDQKVLVVREARTSSDEATISNFIFGTTGDVSNLASQYAACSYNQLTFSAYAGDPIVANGVLTVGIPGNITGDNGSIRNAMVSQATSDLGKGALYNVVDYVMVCIPAGTNSGWIAYAYINHWLSGKYGSYTDGACFKLIFVCLGRRLT